MAAMHVEEGFYGDTRLGGLNWVSIFAWPGAVHEGGGEQISIIDSRADEAQRTALLAIHSGDHSEPGATVFSIFASVVDTTHEPIFAAIAFEVDVAGRTARVSVPGLVESKGAPILNPVTGAEHRVGIFMPEGFEFLQAECGNGSAKTSAAIALDYSDSYGQFSDIHLTPRGPVS